MSETEVNSLLSSLRILELEKALAYEAAVVAAQVLDVKALGKNRRAHVERAIERMQVMALGGYAYVDKPFYDHELNRLKREKQP